MPGGEVWSVNPCFTMGDFNVDITGAEATTIAAAIDAVAIPSGIRELMSSTTLFTGTRVEARSATGVLEALGEHVRTTPNNGLGTDEHPYQTSVVCSLKTATPGGRGRGRLYFPATGAAIVPTSLRLDPALLPVALTGVKTYMAGIAAAIAVTAGNGTLTVWSRTGSAFHNVTGLRMGNVFDTQRRRRDTLIESYDELAYP